MKLKNIVLGIAAIIMIAAIAIGITVAYLTDTAAVSNKMTIGPVDIELREYERVSVDTPNASEEAQVQKFNDNKPLLPAVLAKGFDYAEKDASVKWDVDKDGNPIKSDYTSTIWEPADVNNEVDKMVFVENVGKSPAYVRVFFAFEAGNYTSFTRFQDMIHINLNDTASEWKWEWYPALATSTNGGKYFIASATYQPILEPKQFTTISLSQISLDPTATNDDVLAFGEKYEISVFVQGIQTVGFETAEEAVDEGFGDEIPFKDLTFETGVNLKTALHYLNGEESEDKKITADVSTVTFGLNKDYKNITSKYNPTFIGSEQDVAVYSYYVPNADDASKYDVYVLADSAIYTPKDSKGLFQGMTSLTTVKTTNMDVSRTEIMTNMFRECSALVDINVSAWKLSNAINMTSMFVNCSKLDNLNVRNWNVSNVTSMNSMFYGCNALTHLDVSSWDVGKCTGMKSMFYMCEKLGNLNVSGWDVSQVTTMTYMFRGCQAMTRIDLSDWDVQKVEDMSYMFAFSQDENPSLTELILTGWETTSLENMDSMFHTCKSLKSIDVSDIDTQNVTNMTNVFKSCLKIEEIIGLENWDTRNVKTMKEMFHHCGQSGTYGEWGGNLRVLDLSSFNTSKVTDVSKCSILATVCRQFTLATVGICLML